MNDGASLCEDRPVPDLSPSATMLANRLRKRARHVRKWARRTGTTCYRLYERDMPDQPLVVDWIDGDVVVWAYDRTRDDTPEADRAWIDEVIVAVRRGLDVESDAIFVKRRMKQRGRHEGAGQYEPIGRQRAVKVVKEQGLRFEVNLSDYLDIGLFLDHRPTRKMIREQTITKHVLNLFAYTGSFTCYAAAGGAASTVSVDLSRTYCAWTERNLELNGLARGDQHRIIQADVLGWLQERGAEGDRYDLIICDPPTFSTSKRFEGTFDIARDHPWLLTLCLGVLAPRGSILFSSNAHGFELNLTELPAVDAEDLTEDTVPEDFRNRRAHRCWRLTAR